MDTRRDAEAESEDTTKKKESRGCGCWIILLLILLGGAGATGGLMGMIVLREETPLPGEAAISDLGLRMLAVPGEYADLRLPQAMRSGQGQADAIQKGRELFEVECSLCHGRTGKGDAQLGMAMYPPASDLTAARTQTKSDGQLYWLIAHGVNLTGMPAWGKDFPNGFHSEEELWTLVAYIRSIKGE